MHAFTTTLAALGACAATGIANGDLAVKAQIDITRPSQSGSSTSRSRHHAEHNAISLYFRGDKARLEMQNGIHAIFNGSRNRVYIISDRTQTYYTTTMPSSDEANVRSSYKVPSSATVTIAHPDGALPQTIAGASATRFSVLGSGEFSKIPQRFATNDDGSETPGMRGSIKIDGELWASDTLKLPTNNNLVLSAISSLVAYGATELQQSLQAQLATLNEFPLRSKIVTLRSDRLANTTHTTVVSFSVTSVTFDQLPVTLFEVPSSYMEIESPMGSLSPNGSNRPARRQGSGVQPGIASGSVSSGGLANSGSTPNGDDGGPDGESSPPLGPPPGASGEGGEGLGAPPPGPAGE